MSGLGCLPLPRQRPNPPSSCAEGTYRPRRPKRASSWESHPWPDGALKQQRRHGSCSGPGRGLRVVGRAGDSSQAYSK